MRHGHGGPLRDRAGNPPVDWLAGQLTGGERALDVGCGNGRICRLIALAYREVVGVDLSARTLEVAEAKDNPPNVRYERRDVRELFPEREGLFDAVFALNSVFAMGPAPAVPRLLRALVAPGGLLVILDVPRAEGASAEGGPGEAARETFHPFEVAHTVYRMSGDPEGAVAAIRYMLHPAWRRMSAGLVPMTKAEFRVAYAAALPGVRITEDIVPTLNGAVWRAPAAGRWLSLGPAVSASRAACQAESAG